MDSTLTAMRFFAALRTLQSTTSSGGDRARLGESVQARLPFPRKSNRGKLPDMFSPKHARMYIIAHLVR